MARTGLYLSPIRARIGRDADRSRPATAPRRPSTTASRDAGVRRLLDLQRSAGNQAVTHALAAERSSPHLVVQRHSSWEHALMGDTPPGQLGRAAVTQGARIHVVWAEWQRMRFFRDDPGHIFPDLVASMKGRAIRPFSAEMVSAGLSQDSGVAPPAPVGDFPLPSGGSRPG